jgi:hypothetical protein
VSRRAAATSVAQASVTGSGVAGTRGAVLPGDAEVGFGDGVGGVEGEDGEEERLRAAVEAIGVLARRRAVALRERATPVWQAGNDSDPRLTTCHGDDGRHGVQRRVTTSDHGGHGGGHGIHGAIHTILQ